MKQTLTVPRFLEIQHKQYARTDAASWPRKSGYVDGVIDDRYPDYIRFYVGQSSRLPIRLAVEHAGKIRNGSTKSLHYFILARGHGHRYAQFLRLWSAPPLSTSTSSRIDESADLLQVQYDLIQNVLKMAFCRAFESLQGTILDHFFGSASAAYLNVGLNNLAPLLSGPEISSSVRSRYLAYHLHSPDPDISAFVAIRKEQKAKERNKERQSRPLLAGDYQQALHQQVESRGLDSESLSYFACPATFAATINIEDRLKNMTLITVMTITCNLIHSVLRRHCIAKRDNCSRG